MWTEGRRRYTSNPLASSAREGCGWSEPRPGRFTPGKNRVPIMQEAGWASKPVWSGKETSSPTEFHPRTVHREANAKPTELYRPPFNTWTETNFLFIYLCHFFVVRNSIVDTATRYGLGGPRIESRWERGFPYPFTHPYWPWGLPSLLFKDVGSLPGR